MGDHDMLDNIPSCSYRDYGEVMLYRICKVSGLSTPGHKDCYANGEKADPHYRQIHVGDFKFKKRPRSLNKMGRILPLQNIFDYLRLKDDTNWKRIVSLVTKNNKQIADLMNKVDVHVRKRMAMA